MALPTVLPKEKQYQFIPRCISEVKGGNPTLTDEEAGAMCFAVWQNRYESMHPADAAMTEVSTADWSKVDTSRLPKECFLLVPNPENSKTWQHPVYMGTGGIDPKTGRFKERGELNLNALRMEAAKKKVPESIKARIRQLLAQCEVSERRYEVYRTPEIEESGDAPSRLVETIHFAGAEFVEENGVRQVKNVVMLGPVSSHGYEYRQEAMAKAVSGKLYEGAKIFINHAAGQRDLMHLAGTFKNTRHEGGKVRGDAHLLSDAYGEKFWQIAKTMPEAAGCSHVADGKLVKGEDGKKYVEEITKVHSVDLVVQGATTQNVFEGETPNGKEQSMDWKDIKIEDLRTARPEIARQLVQEGAASRDEEIQALISEKQALVTEKDAILKDKTQLTEEKKQLQAKIDEMNVVEATRQKEAVVDKALRELPEQARTDLFKQQCMGVTTGGTFDIKVFEAKVAELVKDRKTLCEQAGVRNMGGEQTRQGDAPTAEKIAECAKL